MRTGLRLFAVAALAVIVCLGGCDNEADEGGAQDSANSTLRIPNQIIITGPATLPNITAGEQTTLPIGVSGGRAPYTWTVGEGLPPGITLNAATGQISGVPTLDGYYSFEVQVSDASKPTLTARRPFSINVFPAITVQNTPLSMTVGQSVLMRSHVIDGGCGTLRVYSGTMPPGLDIRVTLYYNNGDTIIYIYATGRPTTPGDYSVPITLTDEANGHIETPMIIHVS
ncbi:MAG: putative Ig domain-containing protein [Planctomycetes bacterium]|nr:putative Ig domain-containing protein [Planctomycetota bacterium]